MRKLFTFLFLLMSTTFFYAATSFNALPLENTTVDTLSDISNHFPDSITLCGGDSLIYELPDTGGGEIFSWYKDSVQLNNATSNIVIKESGTYYAKINKDTCESVSNQMVVTVNQQVPNFQSLPQTNQFLCEGENLAVQMPGGYDFYEWFRNGVAYGASNVTFITEPGVYHLMASLNGCTATSETFAVEFFQLPTIDYMADGPIEFCQGDSVNLTAASNMMDVAFSWSLDNENVGSTAQYTATTSGVYLITAVSTMGCFNTTEVEITVTNPITPSIELAGDSLVASQANSYQWYMNGTSIPDAVNSTHMVTENGDYYVSTVDTNGCTAISNTIIAGPTTTNVLPSIKAMTLLDTWDVDTLAAANGVKYNEIWGYVDCDEREYAIMGSASQVHFFDVTDPTNVVEIASFAGGDTTVWRDMKTYKDRAYAVSDNTSEGMMIFDLSDLPNSVTKTYHSTEFFGKSHNIYIEEATGRLYSVGTDSVSGGVIVLDVATDPDNPTLLAAVNLPANPDTGTGYAHDIYVKDNIAYGSHGYLGFFIWDMNIPTQPVLLASTNTGGYNHSSWLTEDGNYAIYAEEVPNGRPLGVINLQGLANGFIEIDHTFKFPLLPNDEGTRPHNPFVRGDYLITSYYQDGLQIFDISDPLNPIQAAYYDTDTTNTDYQGYSGAWGVYPFLPSGNLLVSDLETGLYVLRADSIQLAPINSPAPEDISSYFPDSISICVGDSLIYELPDAGNETFTWFKDSVQLENDLGYIVIHEAGTYYAKINTFQCESISNEMVVTVNDGPEIQFLPIGNSVLCEGETFFLEVPNGYDYYEWTQNETPIDSSNMLAITSSGIYQLTTSVNGCTAMSEVFTVEFETVPTIEIMAQGPTEFCQGNFLNLTASSNMMNASFMWTLDTLMLGNTAQQTATTSGVYVAMVTNGQGCVNTAEIEITVNEPILPTIELAGNILTSTEATYYQWFFNGTLIPNANNQSYAISEVGEYYVGTVDSNGCFGNSNTVMVDIVSTKELEDVQSFSIFPNPVNTLLQIDLELAKVGAYQLEILASNGQIILEKTMTLQKSENLKFDVNDFPQGIYFVRLKNGKGFLMSKFVKF